MIEPCTVGCTRWSSLPSQTCTGVYLERPRDRRGQHTVAYRTPGVRRSDTPDREGLAAREPWGTLLTNHQCRWSGYAFADDAWSDAITIEDLDQADGAVIREYRRLGRAPVVNDEDRYELYRPPACPRYFFRRLMWGSLSSVYLPHPTGDDPGTDDVAVSVPGVAVRLPEGTHGTRWFDPSTGRWYDEATVAGGTQMLTAPGAGDWVLWLQA